MIMFGDYSTIKIYLKVLKVKVLTLQDAPLENNVGLLLFLH